MFQDFFNGFLWIGFWYILEHLNVCVRIIIVIATIKKTKKII